MNCFKLAVIGKNMESKLTSILMIAQAGMVVTCYSTQQKKREKSLVYGTWPFV